ncbi:MAG: hypothetical protein J0I21_08155 [Alphaproteobacteria bacterium]|nr:hypothetical protein [Alphaproteobacteria bacterium]
MAPPTIPARRFCLVWLGALLAILAVVAGFDAAVDPYAVFGAPRLAGFNARKIAAAPQQRMAKTYEVERIRPVTVLLGSSRVDIGLDPASPAWPVAMRPVFNYGLDGMGLRQARAALMQAAATGRLRNAVLVLDPDLGGDAPAPPGPPDETERRLLVRTGGDGTALVPNPARRRQHLSDLFLSALSLGALRDSVRTVLGQDDPGAADLSPAGATGENRFRAWAAASGYHAMFAQKDAANAEKLAAAARWVAAHPDAAPDLGAVARIIAFCRAHGLRLVIIIPPVHEHLLNQIAAHGLADRFARWKAGLAALVPASDAAVQLWDFSGAGPYVSEPMPPPDDRHTMLRWFWDPTHFTRALGERLLRRVLGGPADGFGARLTAEVNTKADTRAGGKPQDVARAQP